MIDAEEVQDRRVEIVDRDDVLDAAAAQFVGGPVADAPLHAGPHHPGGEGVGVVIAASLALLAGGHPTELRAPDHEHFVEHAPLLEIGEQAGRRLVEDRQVPVVIGLERRVGVPVEQAVDGAGPRCTVEADIPHAPLEHSPREQAVAGVGGLERVGVVGAVELPRLRGLTREIGDLGRGRLHPRRQFVGRDPRPQFLVAGAVVRVPPVHLVEKLSRRQILRR